MSGIWKYGAAGLFAATLASAAFAQNTPVAPPTSGGNTTQSATGTRVNNNNTGCTTPGTAGNTSQSATGTRVAGNNSPINTSGNTSQSATGTRVGEAPCR